jgi:Tol biopolymer transport system component
LREAFPDWVKRQFGEADISLFFPILSPDMQRVMFKVSSPTGGGFRSPKGSTREGLLCYDLIAKKFVFMQPRWGHPAWHPDSRQILNIRSEGVFLIDSETGQVQSNPRLPPFPGGHPSLSPDGKLFVTDTQLESFGGSRGDWGVVVGDISSGQHEIIHRFDNTQGAMSWRRSHPHPVFSHDGRRIYFNASDGDWTRLLVAEHTS